jgi:hypothetical protein
MNNKIVYCTIASANYLGRVQVLAKSLKEHNPGTELHILLCERSKICQEISNKTGHQFYSSAEIGCDDWLHMAFYYNTTEFTIALKPFFLEFLMEKGYDTIFYFDPSIEIFSSLKEMENLIPKFDILLTPYICSPVPDDKKAPSMEAYIRAGQFNLGCLGLSNSRESRGLLKWWQDICKEKCIFNAEHKYYADQFWADIFPSFNEKTFILRDCGYNVACWNIFQRELGHNEGKWFVDSCSLKFFNFSGLSRDDLTKVSIRQNRVSARKGSNLYLLLNQYFEKISRQEWTVFTSVPYSFAKYANGEQIKDEDRKKFLQLSHFERKEVPDPFSEHDTIKNIIRINLNTQKTAPPFGLKILNPLKQLYVRYVLENILINNYFETMRTHGIRTALWYSIRFIFNKIKGLIVK